MGAFMDTLYWAMGWEVYESIRYNGPDYGFQGFMDEDAKAMNEMADMMMAGPASFGFDNIDEFRALVSADYSVPGVPTGWEQWNEQVTRSEAWLNPPFYSIMHEPLNKKYGNGPNCGLMYFHGGGGVAGRPEDEVDSCDRFAVETGCTVFNTHYRLAPENIAPAGMEDGFNGLVYLYENAAQFGLNPEKLAYYGASGGAWIASGVGMLLAEAGLSHIAKF
jgi:acetyl esterase